MRKFVRYLLLAAVSVSAFAALPSRAQAQFPVTVTQVQPVVPTVVGFTAERRGLFGWRTVYRPVVAGVAAPVVTAVPMTSSFSMPMTSSVAMPMTSTVTVARPIISQPFISQPVVVGMAPSVTPTTSFFAPAPAPVTSFFAPPVSVVTPVTMAPVTVAPVAVAPVTTFRVPTQVVVPTFGF